MSDRTLGYTVIGFVTVFLLLPLCYLAWRSSPPLIFRTITFENVPSLAFLTRQEPVRMQGVEIGTVRDVSVRNDTAFVRIASREPIRLYQDYSIIVMAKGVMGDRYLTIHPGSPWEPYVAPDAVLRGTVGVSPDDALRHFEKLRSALGRITLLSERLARGEEGNESLVKRIQAFATTLDSVVRRLSTSVVQIDSSLPLTIDHAALLLDKSIGFIRNGSDSIDSSFLAMEKLISGLFIAIDKLEASEAAADTILLNAGRSGVFLPKKDAAAIRKKLTTLQNLIRQARSDSLALRIRVW